MAHGKIKIPVPAGCNAKRRQVDLFIVVAGAGLSTQRRCGEGQFRYSASDLAASKWGWSVVQPSDETVWAKLTKTHAHARLTAWIPPPA